MKNDAADTGMGIYASAQVMDLDFVPICEERYDFCILPDLLDEERLDILLQTISSERFKQSLIQTGGYNTDLSGKIIFENRI